MSKKPKQIEDDERPDWPFALEGDYSDEMPDEVKRLRKKGRIKLRCFIYPKIEPAYDRDNVEWEYEPDGYAKYPPLPICEKPEGFEVVIFFADPTPTPGHLRTVCQCKTIEEALAAQRAVQRTLGQFVDKSDYAELKKLYKKYG